MVNPPDPPTGEQGPLACDASIADYCARNSCDQSLDTAMVDSHLCASGGDTQLVMCGSYKVILQRFIDTSTAYYYQDGQLVAIVGAMAPNRYHCAAGPGMFTPAQCSPGTPLLACHPPGL